MLIAFSAYSQESFLTAERIEQTSIGFSWGNINTNNVILEYGHTKELELGEVKGLVLTLLDDASSYYVKAKTTNKETEIQLFVTASKSSGNITVYFNQWVDNNASSIADAIQVTAFEDTIIAYINSAQNTLDICNYNTGSLPIITAINNAETSGITIRYISADNTGTNNDELTSLSSTIPTIQRPDDGEVMHNKFIIIDCDNSQSATVLTGSVNHTDNSCHEDYNNMVIINDQSLALAYRTEFEEMWGSTGNTPNTSNAKFGAAKTDNTPHSFSIGGVSVELYFSPSDGTTAHIESAILSANTDMQFAMLTFINNDLGDAVISIHNSGVDVKGIIDNDWYWGSEFDNIEDAGVDVYAYSGSRVLHHKYGIVDANNISSDPLVITGSHNWTNSAEDDYDENTLIIHDAEIANMYYEEFMARYAEITGTVSIDENKISESDFSIYPNPTSDELSIKSKYIIGNITVQNSIGQSVINTKSIQRNNYNLNVSYLPCGVYYVSVLTQNETIVYKLIKE